MKKSKFTWYVYDKKTYKIIVSWLPTSEDAHEIIKKLDIEKPEWWYKLSCELAQSVHSGEDMKI